MIKPTTGDGKSVTSLRTLSGQSGHATMKCTNISNLNQEEWNVRRHNSANSLRQLAMACTPKRGDHEERRSSQITRRSRRRNLKQDKSPSENPVVLRRLCRSASDIRSSLGERSTSSTDSERKVIRSLNSKNYSWSKKRIARQDCSRNVVNHSSARSNYAWSEQVVQTHARTGTTSISAIPDSVQVVCGYEVSASTSEQHVYLSTPSGQTDETSDDDDDSSVSSSTSTLESEDDFYVPQGLSAPQPLRWQDSEVHGVDMLQKNLDEALASLVGGGPTTRPPPYSSPQGLHRRQAVRRTPRSFGQDSIDSNFRLDDSKRTASTMASAGSASECNTIQVLFVQPPQPWICLCGESNDEDFRFCGMCSQPKNWTCTCGFARNKCRHPFCGGCGSRRMGMPKPVHNHAA